MTHSAGRVRRLVAEGVDNAWSGRLLSVATVALVAAIVCASGWFDASAAAIAIDSESELRSAGGYVVRIAPASAGSTESVELLRRGDCERLAQSDLVEAAGSTSVGVDTQLVPQPAETLSLVSVSPGFLGVVSSLRSRAPIKPIPTESLVVASDRAADLELIHGEQLAVGQLGPADVTVAPLATLAPGFGSSAMTVVPPVGGATACYVAVSPAFIDRSASLATVFGRDDLSVERVLAGAELVEPPRNRLISRTSRHSTWLSGLVVFGCWITVLWIKRSDRALYRTLGVTPNDLRLIVASEGLAIVAVGGAVGVVTALMASLTTLGAVPATVGLWSSVAALAASAAAMVAASCASRSRHLLDHLKDR